ncbi:1-alkyl-2-acetylglycerophosphocholine esterase [Phlyctema vagabunda]|uniref:1-alkyl-2-acetylglycerophosphocholine esterase n=1 Tax=Phlyctema vagabunda TaxID=108571 RepID=A0ABR4P663_9HELO
MSPFARVLQIGVAYLNIQLTLCAVLPTPSGPYKINSLALAFTDASRNDTGAADFPNLTVPRSLMTTIYYPITSLADNKTYISCSAPPYSNDTTAFLPPVTASFLSKRLELPGLVNLRSSIPNDVGHPESTRARADPQQNIGRAEFPLLLFSPAFATSRLLYASLLSDLASHGYVVVSLDHPYDTDIVEFPSVSSAPPNPGGEVIYSPFLNVSDPELLIDYSTTAQEIRAEDISFIVSILLDPGSYSGSSPPLPLGLPNKQQKPIILLGHSLGGASALLALSKDARLAAAINLDGFIFGPASNSYLPDFGTDKPFLLMSSRDGGGNTESWDVFWDLSRFNSTEDAAGISEKSRWVEWATAQHYDFSDLPLVLATLGVNDFPSQEIRDTYPLERNVTGFRKREIVRESVLAFLAGVVDGVDGGVVDGESDRFPELNVVKRGDTAS